MAAEGQDLPIKTLGGNQTWKKARAPSPCLACEEITIHDSTGQARTNTSDTSLIKSPLRQPVPPLLIKINGTVTVCSLHHLGIHSISFLVAVQHDRFEGLEDYRCLP